VKALARALGCDCKRVQFTPDLLPSDVVGMNIYDRNTGSFRRMDGPVMTNLLLADEINRAIPRTQSALLEAMEERQVTLDGRTLPLPSPYLVLATENPVELESTFRLPAAQLDRFLLRLTLGYPSPEQEEKMLRAVGDVVPFSAVPAVTDASELSALQKAVRAVEVSDDVAAYIVRPGSPPAGIPAPPGGQPPGLPGAVQGFQGPGRHGGPGLRHPGRRRGPAHPVLTHRWCSPGGGWRARPPTWLQDEILAALPVPPSAGPCCAWRYSSLGAHLQPLHLVPVIRGCLAWGSAVLVRLTAAPGLLFFAALLGLASRLWGGGPPARARPSVRASRPPPFPGEETPSATGGEQKAAAPWCGWSCASPPPRGCVVPTAFVLTQPEELEVNAGGRAALPPPRPLLPPGGAGVDTVWRASCPGVCPSAPSPSAAATASASPEHRRRLHFRPADVVVGPAGAVDSAPFSGRGQGARPEGLRGGPLRALRAPGLLPLRLLEAHRLALRRPAGRAEVKPSTPSPRKLHFLVDGASFSPDELEDALSVLGSLSADLGEAGVRCGLTLPEHRPSPSVTLYPSTPGDRPRLLNALAAYDGEDRRPCRRRADWRPGRGRANGISSAGTRTPSPTPPAPPAGASLPHPAGAIPLPRGPRPPPSC
jgi:MoxR-like ATPase